VNKKTFAPLSALLAGGRYTVTVASFAFAVRGAFI
jgi:hypothetical protein